LDLLVKAFVMRALNFLKSIGASRPPMAIAERKWAECVKIKAITACIAGF